MKSDNFVIIQGWMCNELELKGNELLVYALIYGFSQDGKSDYHGGRQYISDTFNISLPTVDKALKGLVDKNLIIKIPCKDQSQTDTYKANISSKETLLPGSKETLPHNIYNKNIDNTDNTNVLSGEIANTEEFLISPETHSPKKSSTSKTNPKKRNLYSSCIEVINNFTEEEDVRECLRDFLNMRIANTQKPFGVKSFEGMLKKLRTLTTSKKEVIKIITQATDRCYLTFYPITGYSYSKPSNPEIISKGEKRSITDEEFEEAIKLGQKF